MCCGKLWKTLQRHSPKGKFSKDCGIFLEFFQEILPGNFPRASVSTAQFFCPSNYSGTFDKYNKPGFRPRIFRKLEYLLSP